MSSKLDITRRDFMGGVALTTAAGTLLSPLEALAQAQGNGTSSGMGNQYYPPKLTGMRGSHKGSFEVAHGIAWAGERWDIPSRQTDETYDLVVVGAGISGLAAAFQYRQETGPDARILILDNHDDFGGHAKRNEFDVDGHHLIGYGGSQALEAPGDYSPESKKLLRDISVDVERFYTFFDQGFHKRWGLENGIYFKSDKFGDDRLLPDPFGNSYRDASEKSTEDIISRFPVLDETKAALLSLINDETDYLPGLGHDEKAALLKKMSYVDFLEEHVGLPLDGREILQDKFKSYWAMGWDALSALEAFRLGMPGTYHMGLSHERIGNVGSDEPYIFHFPDGNAGVARALVRRLIPEAIRGSTMEDLVPARADYSKLDQQDSAARIRLNSTAVDVRHTANGNEVDITYVQDGKAQRVRGKHVIMACYNHVIPFICPELPGSQRQAIEILEKAPLVYVNIAIRNWRAFAESGYHNIFVPKADIIYSLEVDFPISMGGYDFTSHPDQPTVIHSSVVPNSPGSGMTAREQHVAGRHKMYEWTFDDFEKEIIASMDGALGSVGFDAGRDIAAITVNRWPHGYADEYNELFDPAGWGRQEGPHVAGRAQIGRISIANSDSSAYAYVDGAIDAAVRAVNEQIDSD